VKAGLFLTNYSAAEGLIAQASLEVFDIVAINDDALYVFLLHDLWWQRRGQVQICVRERPVIVAVAVLDNASSHNGSPLHSPPLHSSPLPSPPLLLSSSARTDLGGDGVYHEVASGNVMRADNLDQAVVRNGLEHFESWVLAGV